MDGSPPVRNDYREETHELVNNFSPSLTLIVAGSVLTAILVLAAVSMAVILLSRRLAHRWTTKPLNQTLMQLALSLMSTEPTRVLLLEQQAETGDMVLRPMGSRQPARNLQILDFVSAQLTHPPLPLDAKVDLSVEIGPQAPRPVTLQLPVFISGMAYGQALSRWAKLALVRGAALAGTAINSGEGAWLPEEPVLAYRWFYQIGRGDWTHRPDLIRLADLVEIHVGQGAEMSAPLTKPTAQLGRQLSRSLNVDGPSAVIRSGLHWRGTPKSLSQLVQLVREINPDCPVGVKLGATDLVEADILEAVEAGVDFITLDAEQAGTGNAPQSLVESTGIPFLHMLVRAVRHLEKLGVRGRISLIVAGGLRDTNDFLKAMALGADALGIGTAALIALAHRQFEETLHEPPWSLVQHGGTQSRRFNSELAARNLANYLISCRKEMALMLRTIGKASVRQLDPSDLCCDDPILARDLGVHYSLHPLPPSVMYLQQLTGHARRLQRDVNSLLARASHLTTNAGVHIRQLQE